MIVRFVIIRKERFCWNIAKFR